MENIFIHHVFFWLADATPLNQKKLIEGLKTLEQIPLLRRSHIGQPAATSRGVIDNSYALSWYTEFATAEDETIYQTHPIHLAFVENYKHLWSKVVVYDSIDVNEA